MRASPPLHPASLLILALLTTGLAAQELPDAIRQDLHQVQASLPEGVTLQLDRRVPLEGELTAERYLLGNGLALLYLQDRSAPVVSVQMWVRVGSRHEEPGKTGLAHLFEHLMFRATTNHPDGEFDRIMEAHGCETNADTWLDRTRYYEDLPADALSLALELDADRLVNLRVEEEPFRSELDVVMNERRQRVDNDPAGKIDELLLSALFGPDHPYGWPTLGWMADLQGMTLADTRAFYARWYRPGNVTLVVVGDVRRAELLRQVGRTFGPLPAGPPPPDRRAPLLEHPATARVETAVDVTTDRLHVAYLIPPARDPDLPAVEVAAHILAGGDHSRWHREVVEREVVAREVWGWVADGVAEGYLELAAEMVPGRPAETALAPLDRILADLAASGPTPEEVEGAVSSLQTQAYASLRTAHGRARDLGFSEVILQDPAASARRRQAVSQVTADDVRRVVERYLQAERRTVLLARPEEKEALPEPSPDRPAPGPGGSLVLVEPDSRLPLVSVRVVLREGSASDPPELAGLTEAMVSLLPRGAGGRSRDELAAALEHLGTGVSTSVDRDSAWLSATVLSRNLPECLALLGTMVTRPDLPAEELEKVRVKMQAAVTALREDDDALAERFLDRALFGESGYGTPPGGTLESLAGLTRDRVLAHYHRLVTGPGVILAAAGDVETDRFRELCQEHFSGLRPGPALPPAAPRTTALLPPGLAVVLVDKPERTQARWILARPAPGWGAGPLPGLEVGDTCFGGTYKSRLNSELRIRRGWTYGAYSELDRRRTLGVWAMSSATEEEHATEAIQIAREMLASWLENGITPEETEQARSFLVNRRPFEVDTPEERLDQAIFRTIHGLPESFDTEYVSRIQAVTPEAVRESVSQVLGGMTSQVLVVVATASDVEAGLRALPGVSRFRVVRPSDDGPVAW